MKKDRSVVVTFVKKDKIHTHTIIEILTKKFREQIIKEKS